MHEEDNNIISEDEKAKPSSQPKPDKTTRKKLENYLDDLELKRQLEDWGDFDDEKKPDRKTKK